MNAAENRARLSRLAAAVTWRRGDPLPRARTLVCRGCGHVRTVILDGQATARCPACGKVEEVRK